MYTCHMMSLSVIDFTASRLLLSSSFCCVYLAFKIDEYVVSMDQFVNAITPDLRREVVEYVLSHEV